MIFPLQTLGTKAFLACKDNQCFKYFLSFSSFKESLFDTILSRFVYKLMSEGKTPALFDKFNGEVVTKMFCS